MVDCEKNCLWSAGNYLIRMEMSNQQTSSRVHSFCNVLQHALHAKAHLRAVGLERNSKDQPRKVPVYM